MRSSTRASGCSRAPGGFAESRSTAAASELSSVPTEGCRSLGEYIEALVEELGRADPAALARMGEIVGSRRARIAVDDESVDVKIVADALVVETSSADAVDGEGMTDRGTVLDLIDGYIDVADAIL